MRRLLLLCLLLVATACGKKAEPSPVAAPVTATSPPSPENAAPTSPDAANAVPDAPAQPAPDTAPASDAAPAAPDAAATAAPNDSVDGPAKGRSPGFAILAKALITAWVAAQNDASFDAYAANYAPRFTGIKRSGTRERTFGRAGWLADRTKMFKQAMQVSLDDIHVVAVGDTAIVTFVQSWASGSYSDKGPKQLVLVPTRDGLKIAREEMLRSELVTGDVTAKPIDPALYGAVISAGSEVYLALTGDNLDDAWGRGAPVLARKNGPTTVVRATDAAALPTGLKEWIGKKVVTDTGCEATIDRVDLVMRYQPHFGVVQGWNGMGDMGNTTPMSDSEIAADAWKGGAGLVAAAHLSGCKDGIRAREAGAAKPTVFNASEPAPALRDAAVAELRALAGWKALAREAKDSEPPVTTASWDEWEGARPEVRAWQDDASGRMFVQVRAAAGSGCGQFGGSFGAVFEVKDAATKPTFVLLTDPQGGPTKAVQQVVDLDGDGEVELVLPHGLVQRAGAIWAETIDWTPPDFDCPC